MASKKPLFLFLILLCARVQGVSFFERSYDYVMSWGKSISPTLMSILDCIGEDNAWTCVKDRTSRLLDGWEDDVQQQRRMWQEAADAEVITSGRSFEELPSKLGKEVEDSLNSLVEAVHYGMARALAKKHHEGGIDAITISTGSDKKKMKKKKPKPPKIHLLHPMVIRKIHKEKGREFPNGVQSWVIGSEHEFKNDDAESTNDDINENFETDSDTDRIVESENDINDTTSAHLINELNFRKGKGVVQDLWSLGEKAIDAVAEHAIETENAENGVSDKSSIAGNGGDGCYN